MAILHPKMHQDKGGFGKKERHHNGAHGKYLTHNFIFKTLSQSFFKKCFEIYFFFKYLNIGNLTPILHPVITNLAP